MLHACYFVAKCAAEYYDYLYFCTGKEDDESVLIDVLSHESEDEKSSTTSGSDGGCTLTSHRCGCTAWLFWLVINFYTYWDVGTLCLVLGWTL